MGVSRTKASLYIGGQGWTVQSNFLYGGSLEVASKCPPMGGDRCSVGLPLYSYTSNCEYLLEEAVSHG